MVWTYGRRNMFVGRKRGQSELMHHPIRFSSSCSSALVENKGFLQPDAFGAGGGGVDRPVCAGRLPKSGTGYAVRPRTVSIFSVSRAVEIPFFFSSSCQL